MNGIGRSETGPHGVDGEVVVTQTMPQMIPLTRTRVPCPRGRDVFATAKPQFES